LLAQGEDPFLHATRDRVEFNMDHRPPRADQGRKTLPFSYFSLFLNINVQIRPGMTRQRHRTTAKSPQQCRGQHDLTATLCHGQHRLSGTIASMV
jgi:hypothetical protein